jgi:hypothetical protein
MRRFVLLVLSLSYLPGAQAQELYRYPLGELLPPFHGRVHQIQALGEHYLVNTELGLLLLDQQFRLIPESLDFWALGIQEGLPTFTYQNQVLLMHLQDKTLWAPPTSSRWKEKPGPTGRALMLEEELFSWTEEPFPQFPAWQWGEARGSFPFFPDRAVHLVKEGEIFFTSLIGEKTIWRFHHGRWDKPELGLYNPVFRSFLENLPQGAGNPTWGIPQAPISFADQSKLVYADLRRGEIVSSQPLGGMSIEEVLVAIEAIEEQWQARSALGALGHSLEFWQRYWEEQDRQNPLTPHILSRLRGIQRQREAIRAAIRGTGTLEIQWAEGKLLLRFTPDGLRQKVIKAQAFILSPRGWEALELEPKPYQEVTLTPKPLLINVLITDNNQELSWANFVLQ